MNPPHYNDAFDLEEERANRLKERTKLMRAMAPRLLPEACSTVLGPGS